MIFEYKIETVMEQEAKVMDDLKEIILNRPIKVPDETPEQFEARLAYWQASLLKAKELVASIKVKH